MAINPSDDVDVLGTFLRILLNNDRWHKQRQEIIIDQTSSTPIACLSSYDLSLLLAIVWCRWCHVKGDRGHRSWRMIMIYTIKCWCTCTISIKLKYIQQSTKRWLIKIIQQYTLHWRGVGTMNVVFDPGHSYQYHWCHKEWKNDKLGEECGTTTTYTTYTTIN